jgi:hypothetical protein
MNYYQNCHCLNPGNADNKAIGISSGSKTLGKDRYLRFFSLWVVVISDLLPSNP